MTMSRRFEWLENDLSLVKTKGFLVVEGPASPRLADAIEKMTPLPASYKEFALRFGTAKLFKERGGFAIGVLAPPERATSPEGEELLRIGHSETQRAFFRRDLLAADRESPVFEGGRAGLRQAADNFEAWLRSRYEAARKKIGKTRWSQIERGPDPFSPVEREIVSARKQYRVTFVGAEPDGCARFQVTNGSDRALPFYSIGVRNKEGHFEGRAWLPVKGVAPGETAIVTHDVYKQYIDLDKREFFELPDPMPEERDEYWEFRRTPA